MDQAQRSSVAMCATVRAQVDHMTTVESAARRILEVACAVHGDVQLADDAFVACVREHAAAAEDPERFLAELHGPDLFLACAAGHCDPAAIARFTTAYAGALRQALMRQGHDLEIVAEIEQLLYVRLLVATHGERPRIASYNGRVPLGAWLRVAAIRLGIDLVRRESRHAACELHENMPELAVDLDPTAGPAQDATRASFEAAFLSLDRRQKRLLRLHYLDGMGLEQLASRYKVHRATVSRWIVDAREQLLLALRRHLRERLQLADGEVDSLLRVVDSRFELSIERFLK
jgi:RNA polymerase sigma-70 factor, ECF subfamily